MNWFQVSSVRRMCGAVRVSWLIIRELKQNRFWATHVNRKWGLFPLNMLWLYKFVLFSFFTLTKTIWLNILAKPLICVAQKRRCLSFLTFFSNLDYGFQLLRNSGFLGWVPDSKNWIPDSKAQTSGFPEQKTSWIALVGRLIKTKVKQRVEKVSSK